MNTMKAVLRFILTGLVGLAMIAAMVFAMVEWASGCGESYIDSKGQRHSYECFFNQPKGK